MALAQDIANKSIKDAIRLLAEAVDKAVTPDLSQINSDIGALKTKVQSLDEAINGVPADETPTPVPTIEVPPIVAPDVTLPPVEAPAPVDGLPVPPAV